MYPHRLGFSERVPGNKKPIGNWGFERHANKCRHIGGVIFLLDFFMMPHASQELFTQIRRHICVTSMMGRNCNRTQRPTWGNIPSSAKWPWWTITLHRGNKRPWGAVSIKRTLSFQKFGCCFHWWMMDDGWWMAFLELLLPTVKNKQFGVESGSDRCGMIPFLRQKTSALLSLQYAKSFSESSSPPSTAADISAQPPRRIPRCPVFILGKNDTKHKKKFRAFTSQELLLCLWYTVPNARNFKIRNEYRDPPFPEEESTNIDLWTTPKAAKNCPLFKKRIEWLQLMKRNT